VRIRADASTLECGRALVGTVACLEVLGAHCAAVSEPVPVDVGGELAGAAHPGVEREHPGWAGPDGAEHGVRSTRRPGVPVGVVAGGRADSEDLDVVVDQPARGDRVGERGPVDRRPEQLLVVE
jgi:hypothetical protein